MYTKSVTAYSSHTRLAPPASRWRGYVWAAVGVGLATALFWLIRAYVDKGQASLLYLPVVLALAARFGFGPAILGALLSFLCWDFFFLPPFYEFAIADPKDWLSLAVFLLAAVVTARLASQARAQTQQARAREGEIATLFQASETISREVRADHLLAALSGQLQTLCHATHCLVLRRVGEALCPVPESLRAPDPGESDLARILRLAEAACAHNQVIGFGSGQRLWAKALAETDADPLAQDVPALGVYVPLRAADALVGVLHVGPRDDGKAYSALEARLILTLANHAAVVIARDRLAEQAAEATALREADALKDSLLSLVSHELRTPLAAIKASASGLLQPDSVWEEEEAQEALRAINTEADRLGGVVSNLLDLSRLEAGAWQPLKDWCDLAEVAGTALDRLPPAEAARVEMEAAPDLPLVQADYTQIALVLTNLLENAVKYTPADSPIGLSFQPTDGGQPAASGVTVRIRDYGRGIVPGEEERLFERFYRSPRHQGGTVHGTGLGLALCRAIVLAHGGRTWVANAAAGEPAGAVFTFWLPNGGDE